MVAVSVAGRERATTFLTRWLPLFQPAIFRATYLMTGDVAGAERIATTTFVRAYGALLYKEPDEFVRSWIYRIALDETPNGDAEQLVRVCRYFLDLTDDEISRSLHIRRVPGRPPENVESEIRQELDARAYDVAIPTDLQERTISLATSNATSKTLRTRRDIRWMR